MGFRRRLHYLSLALAHIDPDEFDTEIMVSWDRLLQVAYNYQQSVLSLKRHGCNMDPGTKALQTSKGLDNDITSSTLNCVQLKRRNWDYGTSTCLSAFLQLT
jgi:hypothetical protein